MKNIKWLVLAISVLAIAALACGGGNGGGGGGGGGGGSASLTVVNNSSIDIWYVYISPSDQDTWGNDWLGSHVISAGESYTITGIEPGTYDLMAEDSNHNELATEAGVEIDGPMTWTLSD